MSSIAPCFVCIPEDKFGFIERCGKYSRAVDGGFHCIRVPCADRLAGKLCKKLTQLDVEVETKTKDHVFVKLMVSVQYIVKHDKLYEAFYTLTDTASQISSYVFNIVRSEVSSLTIDELFQSKETIGGAIRNDLKPILDNYGYKIVKSPVTDIEPDKVVRDAMNDINAARRLKLAAQEKAETEKQVLIKQAMSEAEAMRLQGLGTAKQRTAIIRGLTESMVQLQNKLTGLKPKHALDILTIGQWLETIRDIGASSTRKTMLLPINPDDITKMGMDIGQHFR